MQTEQYHHNNYDLELIKDQILRVKEVTIAFIQNISLEKWNETPETINTNMNWQIGHIILSTYIHGIASNTGANANVTKKINLRNFVRFYGPNSIPKMFFDEKPKNYELVAIYRFIFDLMYSGLSIINTEELNKATQIANPNANTKFEALTYLYKHQSKHNEQIASLYKILSINK
jgi:hypothetical protein